MTRRKSAEPPPMFDYWDRLNAQVAGEAEAKTQAINRALEHERQAGRTKRPHARRPRWNINRQRVSEVRQIVLSRHNGPCDTDDAELYLQVALPHFVKLHPLPTDLRIAVDAWASTLLPTLPRSRVLATIAEAEAREWRFANPDEIGRLLNVLLTERSKLGLRTIGAADRTKVQRLKDRKAQNAEYQREKRERNGATPRTRSKAATKPWESEGVSRSTYFARQKARAAELATTPVEASWTASSAIVRSTYLPVTDQSDTGNRTDPGPARKASPRQSVGAVGHTPRAKTRAAPAGRARALPLPIDGVSEHPDMIGGFQQIGDVLRSYAGGMMPDDLARAVRDAQRVRMLTQDALARQIGISRPQLANALQGRFGLSQSAATNLMQWLVAA